MKILLVNFLECPENLHFEQAFIRSLMARERVSLDIIHDFRFPYSFIEKLPPPGGRRVKYSSPADMRRGLRGSYDLLVALDFPKRKACAAPFLRLLRELPRAKKIFIANHLIPMPGHNATADIVKKLGLFSALDLAYILEFDDLSLWTGLGLAAGGIRKRGYAVDCRYYSPSEIPPGNIVFSAGSTGRDYAGLARAVRDAGLALNIFANGPVPPLAAGLRASTSVFPLAANLHNLRQAVREARAVVIPIVDAHLNEAAGNSIAFIAMACGKPVIIKRTPYLERFIKDGKNGFFYERLSAIELSRQLERALSLGPSAGGRLAAAARAAILKKASLEAFTTAFADKFVLKK